MTFHACIFLMNNYNDDAIVNIGSGEEISIKNLAFAVKRLLNIRADQIRYK